MSSPLNRSSYSQNLSQESRERVKPVYKDSSPNNVKYNGGNNAISFKLVMGKITKTMLFLGHVPVSHEHFLLWTQVERRPEAS